MFQATPVAMPISVLTKSDSQKANIDAMKSASDVFQKW